MNHTLWTLVLTGGMSMALHAAEQTPLWEAGAGIAAMTLPAYRGSDVSHELILPVPYLVYHGDFLKADKRGVRAQLFENERLDLNISVSASPPTDDDDVPLRAGMPDLKPTVEIGPELDVTLWEGNADIAFLKLRLPVRQAFTVERDPQNAGVIFTPNLNADIRDVFGPGWSLGIVAGPVFASGRQNAYFYGVDPQYATATRPAYEASGGYGGTQLLLSLSKRYDRMWIGAFMRADTLRGAVFTDSPLVVRDHYFSAGIAISWIFAQAATMVHVDTAE